MSICKKHNLFYDKKNCPLCKKEWDKRYYQNNKEKIKVSHQVYVENNKEEVALYKNQYYLDHKEEKKTYDKVYRENHIERIREYSNEWHQNRYDNDPSFQLRQVVSSSIRQALLKNDADKGGVSFLVKLEYSMQDLKNHLEKQFEPWMTWDNYGKYDVKIWKDDDQSTWTWQIDHIIPQADLPYTSMDDNNFKKCWCLQNLRPLSAKQNLLDGAKRTRHANE